MSKTIQLDDGRLSFEFPSESSGQLITWNADLIEVKLACEAIEKKHKLVAVDGVMVGNVAFFRDLAEGLEEIGCPVTSVSVAMRIWGIVNDRFNLSCQQLHDQLEQLNA